MKKRSANWSFSYQPNGDIYLLTDREYDHPIWVMLSAMEFTLYRVDLQRGWTEEINRLHFGSEDGSSLMFHWLKEWDQWHDSDWKESMMLAVAFWFEKHFMGGRLWKPATSGAKGRSFETVFFSEEIDCNYVLQLTGGK